MKKTTIKYIGFVNKEQIGDFEKITWPEKSEVIFNELEYQNGLKVYTAGHGMMLSLNIKDVTFIEKITFQTTVIEDREPYIYTPPSTDLIKYLYKEDDQMYTTTYYEFETNSPLTVEEMSKVSWEPRGAGRFSTSFTTFQYLMNLKGYWVMMTKKYNGLDGDNKLGVVIGATGNY